MKKFDYLQAYLRFAPLQLALVRSEEVYLMSQVKMAKPILDIGCADGVFGEVLFQGRRGAIEVGIDIDKIALVLARNKSVYKRTIRADARKLPFGKESFATVFSNQGLEHIKDVGRVLTEVNRVLIKRGQFVFLVPTIYLDDYWLTSAFWKMVGLDRIGDLFHRWRNCLFSHYNLWPIKDWKQKLAQAGFKVKGVRYLGSQRRYFISELFWPARIPQLVLSRFLKKPILFPRGSVVLLAKICQNFLEKADLEKPKKGPTMLVIAQKV